MTYGIYMVNKYFHIYTWWESPQWLLFDSQVYRSNWYRHLFLVNTLEEMFVHDELPRLLIDASIKITMFSRNIYTNFSIFFETSSLRVNLCWPIFLPHLKPFQKSGLKNRLCWKKALWTLFFPSVADVGSRKRTHERILTRTEWNYSHLGKLSRVSLRVIFFLKSNGAFYRSMLPL